MTAGTKPFFITLPDRALIRATGVDTHAFLQNIITNDMALLERQPALYTHLLTPQGKFLFDFFITREGDDYLLEGEGGPRADDLLKKLAMYRLRSKVTLTLENNRPVYIVLGTQQPPDPRHPALGHRSLIKPDIEEQPYEIWDRLRLSLGVPDGSRDMVTDKSTMIESRMDVFHGVSFTKGCYIGQEITARMHNRGLAKKHLIPVEIQLPAPASGSDILGPDGHLAGEMRSSCGDLGMAVIKDEALELLKDSPIRPFLVKTHNKV